MNSSTGFITMVLIIATFYNNHGKQIRHILELFGGGGEEIKIFSEWFREIFQYAELYNIQYMI